MTQALPTLFVSHGSPMILLEQSPARAFLANLGTRFGRPRAILVVSAHHDGAGTVVTAAARPETIHDFGGFPAALHAWTYPAPGDPALASEVVARVGAAGIAAHADPARGLDHGAWVPLSLGWPDATIPVVQLSIDSRHRSAWHEALGAALRPLRDSGVLVVGSGSLTHNLRAIFAEGRGHDAAPDPRALAFANWVADRIAAGDRAAVLAAVQQAPDGAWNHPTPDHILPLFVAMGAGGEELDGERLHHSMTYGVLAMDAYTFR